jgi:hypothetical protein
MSHAQASALLAHIQSACNSGTAHHHLTTIHCTTVHMICTRALHMYSRVAYLPTHRTIDKAPLQQDTLPSCHHAFGEDALSSANSQSCINSRSSPKHKTYSNDSQAVMQRSKVTHSPAAICFTTCAHPTTPAPGPSVRRPMPNFYCLNATPALHVEAGFRHRGRFCVHGVTSLLCRALCNRHDPALQGTALHCIANHKQKPKAKSQQPLAHTLGPSPAPPPASHWGQHGQPTSCY